MRTLRTTVEVCTVQPLLPLMPRVENRQEESQDPIAVLESLRQVGGNQQSSVKENLTESLKVKVIVAVRGHLHQAHPENRQRLDRLQEVERRHQIVHQEETLQHQDPTARRHASTTSPEIVQMTNAHSCTLEEEEGKDPQQGGQLHRLH